MAILNGVAGAAGIDPRVHMVLYGPLIAVELTVPQAQPVPAFPPPPNIETGVALVDTGASSTVIDDDVAKKLGLTATGTQPSCGVNGPYVCTEYAVAYKMSAFPGHDFVTIGVTDAPLFVHQGIIMLIGRDLLQNAILTFNGSNGTFSLSW